MYEQALRTSFINKCINVITNNFKKFYGNANNIFFKSIFIARVTGKYQDYIPHASWELTSFISDLKVKILWGQ